MNTRDRQELDRIIEGTHAVFRRAEALVEEGLEVEDAITVACSEATARASSKEPPPL